jgi:hypothetical protein
MFAHRPLKVKELISLLQKCDPEKDAYADVFLRSGFPNDEDESASGMAASVKETADRVYIEAVSPYAR